MQVPSFWVALAAALLGGLIAGAIGGAIALRVRGAYFALITFGMAQVIARIVYNTRALGASDGLIGIPVIDINLAVASVSSASPAGFFSSCSLSSSCCMPSRHICSIRRSVGC